MVFGFIGLLVNIPVNYIFIYGKFGAPALGGVGCGVATGAVYWVMFFMMRFYVRHNLALKDIAPPSRFAKPDWPTLRRLIQLGLPIALALFFEVTLFAIVALLVSPLGIVAVASHQIALNVGSRLGESSVEGAKVAAYTSIVNGIIMACCTGTTAILFHEHIAALYNDSPEVVTLASHLLIFAALFRFQMRSK